MTDSNAQIQHQVIAERFRHHPPVHKAVENMHSFVRQEFESLAHKIEGIPGASRELSLAQTALQEAAMWVNAHIAIHVNKAVADANQDNHEGGQGT